MIYSDSDWAGCVKTRRSTSGGIVTYGSHTVQHWSSTQATVALSSGEAELNANVKAAIESIGAKDLYEDPGRTVGCLIQTDSSAAKGIAGREGCGKLKHLSVKQLWIQEVIQDKRVDIQKIARELNSADALTHHWLGVEGDRHFPRIGLRLSVTAGTLSACKLRGGAEQSSALPCMHSVGSCVQVHFPPTSHRAGCAYKPGSRNKLLCALALSW